MTYHDDKNIDRDIEVRRRNMNNNPAISPWVWGGLAALLLALTFIFMPGNHNNQTAQRPAVTTPTTNATAPARETTGSGAMNRTPDSTATKPAIPGQVPAPASTTTTNR